MQSKQKKVKRLLPPPNHNFSGAKT